MKNNKFVASILGGVAVAGVLLPTSANAAVTQTANIKASAPETLSIALSANEVDFALGSSTDLMKKNITVTGSTNSPAGYKISFSTANDYNSMNSSIPTVTDRIPSINSDTPEALFPTIGWGYSTDGTMFKEIPLMQNTIFTTSTNGTNNHTFTTGVRIAEDIVAGDYENDLLFTIVANIGSASKMQDITYLQEMTPEICDGTPDGYSKQLIDRRDGKKYWTEKFGATEYYPERSECWMVQNLDFDLTVGMTLDPADTNVKNTITVTEVDMIDDGDFYLANGAYGNRVSTAGLAADDEKWHYHEGNFYSFYDATQVSRDYTTGRIEYEANDEKVDNSICPRGWRLMKEEDTTAGLQAWETITGYYSHGYKYGGYVGTTWASFMYSGWGEAYHPQSGYGMFYEQHGIRCIAE